MSIIIDSIIVVLGLMMFIVCMFVLLEKIRDIISEFWYSPSKRDKSIAIGLCTVLSIDFLIGVGLGVRLVSY